MNVRKAELKDLPILVRFTLAEAQEAENQVLKPDLLENGTKKALEDGLLISYWILFNESNIPLGNVSVYREWSEWNCGFGGFIVCL